MDIVIKLSQFLLSLSLLIVLHEFGHFIPAKLFKTRVEKFYLFFDVKFSLLKKKIGETEYGIGWLPLGGYVKISGMIDESMDTEQMSLPPQPWEFRSKPAWQRLIIMLGGVTVNFILAFLIYIGMAFAYGDLYISNDEVKDGIWVTNPAVEKIGLKTGDKIVSVDGQKIAHFHDLNEAISMAKTVEVNRNGQNQTINLPVNFISQLLDEGKRSVVELRIPFVVSDIPASSQNKELKVGDIVQSVNGKALQYADQMPAELEANKGKTIPAIVLRDEKQVAVNLKVNDSAKLGVVYPWKLPVDNLEKLGLYKISEEKYGFFQAIPVGLSHGKEQIASYGRQLKAIFTPSTGAYKGVGGFKAIYDIFPHSWSWEAFWNITALLSIMLGVMNLLPIPALDGGHVLFLLYEMISRRKPSDKFLEYAQLAGFIMLIGLVLFANGNDIYKAIAK
ncbi:RIP metalloprotease RseP [Flavobacterium silvaticum]|uniref:Zinc metalloprotease n=1 Tax=Flavobacterium silvaticum TaxID=1852020 RepID=A0A972FTM2_9FLAO|nr:RIP metalloprotease RseP [Flavobacterium silvaticum]NMH28253.1 RIP metalloprotease RseP [Flavobacterium silvaticum]